MRRALPVFVLLLAAASLSCSEEGEVQATSKPAAPIGMSSWSRTSAPPASAADEETAPLTEASTDPFALDDLLAAAPKKGPETTGPNGASLVGTGTSEERKSPPEPKKTAPIEAQAKPGSVTIGVGDALFEAGMSSPAIERAGRADLYWNLVHRCRDDDGKILPPDAVTMQFTIDAEGSIATSTILTTSADPRYERAAQCMRRELSAVSFRAPPSAAGMATRITMTVPSVD